MGGDHDALAHAAIALIVPSTTSTRTLAAHSRAATLRRPGIQRAGVVTRVLPPPTARVPNAQRRTHKRAPSQQSDHSPYGTIPHTVLPGHLALITGKPNRVNSALN